MDKVSECIGIPEHVWVYSDPSQLTQKHSLILTKMFRLKPASQFVELYNSVVSCALNMEDLISNNF
jgi:hypothetical protein